MSNDCEYVLKFGITMCMNSILSTEISNSFVNKWITLYNLHYFLIIVWEIIYNTCMKNVLLI